MYAAAEAWDLELTDRSHLHCRIQSVLQHLRLVPADATCERCLKLSQSHSRWRLCYFVRFLSLYSHHFFWFPIAPHHELGDNTSSHRERSLFSSPTSTSESRKNLIVVPCDHSISLSSGPDIATLLLKQSSINSLQFTFSHGHIATQWGERMQYKVWQTICVYRDQRKDTQRTSVKENNQIPICHFSQYTERTTQGIKREK